MILLKNICFKLTGVSLYMKKIIKIYDLDGHIVYDKVVCNNSFNVCLKTHCCYKIIIKTKYDYLCKTIYVKNQNCIYLFFDNALFIYNQNSNRITFYLTDYNYENLPIEKGEMIIWQKQ